MEAKIDSVGRVLIPKALRDALGLHAGTTVDISLYGAGVQVIPGGRTAARLIEQEGMLVVEGDGALTDEQMYALIDEGRR